VSQAAFAAAKINLFLHVGPLAPDGFHPLASLMVFADVGDRLRLEDGPPGLAVEGPFAAALAGLDPRDNLVMRAAEALGAREVRLALDKALPVASGVGGGSADAGAALRLLRRARRPDFSDAALEAVAASLGSDGPACLWGAPVVAEGRGERLSAAPRLPELHAVLANPGLACPTGAVYRAFDQGPAGPGADRPAMPRGFASPGELVAFLRTTRNDLEAPAAALVPAVGAALARLRAEPDALFVRLSGSGATAFALCQDEAAASRLSARLSAAEPGWWVRPCRLGGAWPDGSLA
jgi:4-diphosphocytidyl-2-C-methyl-D-erythritol kinase